MEPTKQAAWIRRMGMVLAALVIAVSVDGCNNAAKRDIDSGDHLKVLYYATYLYRNAHKTWPDNLEQIKPYLAEAESHNLTFQGKDLDFLLTNPVTGEKPGYEYVKPKDEPTDAELRQTVILYQRRNGKRDDTVRAAFSDGSVHKVNEPGL